MSKPRDQWSQEYRKRVERAEAKGLTRQQARGHKPKENVTRKVNKTRVIRTMVVGDGVVWIPYNSLTKKERSAIGSHANYMKNGDDKALAKFRNTYVGGRKLETNQAIISSHYEEVMGDDIYDETT